MANEQKIRNYILENYLFTDDQSELDNDDSFLDKGIIDSTGILEIISFLEEGLASGDWDATTHTYYGYERLPDFQHAWNLWVAQDFPPLDRSGSRRLAVTNAPSDVRTDARVVPAAATSVVRESPDVGRTRALTPPPAMPMLPSSSWMMAMVRMFWVPTVCCVHPMAYMMVPVRLGLPVEA